MYIYMCIYIYIAFIFIDVYDLTTMFCPSRVHCFFACSVYFLRAAIDLCQVRAVQALADLPKVKDFPMS